MHNTIKNHTSEYMENNREMLKNFCLSLYCTLNGMRLFSLIRMRIIQSKIYIQKFPPINGNTLTYFHSPVFYIDFYIHLIVK